MGLDGCHQSPNTRGYELQEKSNSSRRRGDGPYFVVFFLAVGESSSLRAWGWARQKGQMVETADTRSGLQRMISMILSYLPATDVENLPLELHSFGRSTACSLSSSDECSKLGF